MIPPDSQTQERHILFSTNLLLHFAEISVAAYTHCVYRHVFRRDIGKANILGIAQGNVSVGVNQVSGGFHNVSFVCVGFNSILFFISVSVTLEKFNTVSVCEFFGRNLTYLNASSFGAVGRIVIVDADFTV